MFEFENELNKTYLEFYGIDLTSIDEQELDKINFAQDGCC